MKEAISQKRICIARIELIICPNKDLEELLSINKQKMPIAGHYSAITI